jgi:hypothetical protein
MLGTVHSQEELVMAVARELCKLIVLRLPRKLSCRIATADSLSAKGRTGL